MKKFIFPKHNSSGLILDTNTLDITSLESSSSYIDWTYVAPEDGILATMGVEKEIKKGDLLLKMYTETRDGEQPIFVLNDPDLIAYIKAYNEARSERNKTYSSGEKALCNDCESSSIMQG